MKCPKCGEECVHNEVDIGVGILVGPPWCSSCGWWEDELKDGIFKEELDKERG